MGMYTELIFGCSLKKETPSQVIDVLKYLVRESEEPESLPEHKFFACERWSYLFTMCSFYFGVNRPVNKMWFEEIGNNWVISTRSNIKNYDGEIESFLEWIEPYVESGSGNKNLYAISCYEDGDPELYFLEEKKS